VPGVNVISGKIKLQAMESNSHDIELRNKILNAANWKSADEDPEFSDPAYHAFV
jgi:hypothetical protein